MSADISSYLLPSYNSFLGKFLHGKKIYTYKAENLQAYKMGEKILFLGVAPLLLMLFSIKFLSNDLVCFYFVLLSISLLLSTQFFVPFTSIPLLSWFRVPARFSIVVFLCLSILAGFGFMRLKKYRFLLAILFSIIILSEYYVVDFIKPVCYYECPDWEDEKILYTWLREQKDIDVIVELPEDFNVNDLYMLASIVHGKKIMNGRLSYSPKGYNSYMRIINRFPAKESIEKLREFNVSYVVLHGEKVNDEKVKLLKSVGDIHVYKIS